MTSPKTLHHRFLIHTHMTHKAKWKGKALVSKKHDVEHVFKPHRTGGICGEQWFKWVFPSWSILGIKNAKGGSRPLFI